MNNKHTKMATSLISALLFGLLLLAAPIRAQAPGQRPSGGMSPRPLQNTELTPIKSDTTRTLSSHFTQATTTPIPPDAKGFIRRWLVLEPVKKNIRDNRSYTDSYLRNAFNTDNFNPDFAFIPKKGSTVTIDNQELKWHALDSKLFNFKLFRFAYALNKPQYGVLFWGVTVINCKEELKNVRMVAGINSAGMLWLNGKEAIMLSSDRDMVVDDAASPRITLNKGKNVIRIGVINGPGMSDFCVRFLDETLQPVTNFTISCE